MDDQEYEISLSGHKYKVKLGVCDEFAVKIYSYGHCHSLAYVLNEIYGYPMYAIETNEGVIHVVSRVKENLYLDALGAKTFKELREFFDKHEYGPFKFYEININSLIYNWGFEPVELKFTKSIINEVIKFI